MRGVSTGTDGIGDTKLLTSERVRQTRELRRQNELSMVYERVNKAPGLRLNESANVSLSKPRNVGYSSSYVYILSIR